MIDPQQHLVSDLFSKEIKQEATRMGFGRGLVEAAQTNKNIVALCADLTESTRIIEFAKAFPERYVEIGIGEQNLVTAAAGMALAGEELEEIGADSIDAGELGEDIKEAEIGIRLDRGEHRAHVWFSDLGYEYVRINAEYTT